MQKKYIYICIAIAVIALLYYMKNKKTAPTTATVAAGKTQITTAE